MEQELVWILGICIFITILQAYAVDNNSQLAQGSQGQEGDGAQTEGAIQMSPELSKIFEELSWVSKLQLLDQYYPTPNKTLMSMDSLMMPFGPDKLDVARSQVEPKNPRSRRADRKVGMSAMKMPHESHDPVAGRRQTPSGDGDPPGDKSPRRDDETIMKLKLFRLMYETVRDADLKVMRAELIKTQYVNSSHFELGYLMGDISDKYNIMSDIALTLQRLYNEWKPIEHINAYEQIASQAIEISHLIDLAKTVHKREDNIDKNDNKN